MEVKIERWRGRDREKEKLRELVRELRWRGRYEELEGDGKIMEIEIGKREIVRGK